MYMRESKQYINVRKCEGIEKKHSILKRKLLVLLLLLVVHVVTDLICVFLLGTTTLTFILLLTVLFLRGYPLTHAKVVHSTSTL